ncbi:MAG: membrane-bound lytic murein transglycosylase B [Paracoccaceae bacterium]|jgi:membrane-bound lytic murein transglycosylase B
MTPTRPLAASILRPLVQPRARRGALAVAIALIALTGCASADAPATSAAPAPRPGAQDSAPAAAPKPAASPATSATAASPIPAPRPDPAATARAAAEELASFAAWRAAFRVRALAAGIRPALFDRAFQGVTPNARVTELDAFQPEFVRPIWAYLDSAVSATRVAKGREKRAELSRLLADIETRHGVDRDVVLAIWGIESNFGANRGNIGVIEALATLAHHGRRQEFAETQLIAALRILDAGEVAPDAMRGSWAGAMGHTQFIPTSYADYAVDQTGDGKRDVWGEDPSDALASTAAYLARFGWTQGAPWGAEVRLPSGFDLSLADQSVRRGAGVWSALGVSLANGAPLPDMGEMSIILPAGADGPAFAAYPNFRVIKRYNNATSYAMAVGILAQRIGGAADPAFAWPRDQRTLTVAEMSEVQALLGLLGHPAGVPDGIIGPNTQAAIRAFQRARGLVPDGHVSAPLLDALRAAEGG